MSGSVDSYGPPPFFQLIFRPDPSVSIRLVSAALSRKDHEILTAADSAEALALLHIADVDALVACRELGYDDGLDIGNGVPDGTGTIWMDQVACVGTETR